jgi:hypothetical protein
MGGTGLAGGTSSIGAQSAGNLNDMMGRAQTNAFISQDALANARNTSSIQIAGTNTVQGIMDYGRQSAANAQGWGQVAGLAGTVFGATGGPEQFAKGVNTAYDNWSFDREWNAGMKV